MSDDNRPGDSGSPAAPDGVPSGVDPPGEAGAAADLGRLPPSPRRRSPAIAVAVIGLGGLLLVHQLDDTRYALRSSSPVELGDARALSPSLLVDNTLVAVRGQPDLRNALLFEPKGDRYRRAFYRLLGTNTRLLVRAEETSSRHEVGDRLVGRLRRFDRIPWAEQLRDYYAQKVKSTRFVDLDRLKSRLADGKTPLADRAGDPLDLGPGDAIGLEVDFPADLLVSLPRKQFPVEEDARHELSRLGVPVGSGTTTNDWYIFVVRVDPARRDPLLKQLDEKEWPFAARRERLTATLGDLRLDGDGLSLAWDAKNPTEWSAVGGALVPPSPPPARTQLPWARVASVQVAAPIRIPPDAFILVENELPSDYRWTLVLDGVLALFLAFNAWLLIHRLRRPRDPESAQPGP